MITGSGKIPKKDAIFLLLSQEAYERPSKRLHKIKGFTYDPSLSSLRTAVYHNASQLIIAHRGTVPSDHADILADAFIANDTFASSSRAKSSLTATKRAMRKYPQLTVIQTGHSLGGATAQFVGAKTNTRVVAFNAGSSPYNLLPSIAKWFKCKANPDAPECREQRMQTLYTTVSDPIAFWQLPVSTIVTAEKWNPHSMENYIPEGGVVPRPGLTHFKKRKPIQLEVVHSNPPFPARRRRSIERDRSNMIKNPATGRWVKKTGRIGKRLLSQR